MVEVYTYGLVAASACGPADLPIEEFEREVNVQVPTGLPSLWRVSEDPTFSGGQPNPCPCELKPGNVHRLFYC